jgi:hypothetical protein
MSKTLKIRKELEKIAKLLWSNGREGKIHFDHKSYDNETDIPHLDIDGERVWVNTFVINRDGSQFTLICGRDSYILDLDAIPSEWDDDYFIEIGLDVLLRDVYYETSESYEIGDYELDFLNKR